MSKPLEVVTVSLGIPREGDGPMPATVFDRRQRRICYQYLSPSAREVMGEDRTARFLAEYVPGWESVPARWELRTRVEW